MGNKDIVHMANIKKSYSNIEVLHGVSLTVREGEVHALLGENGAGKSTLVKILMGEEKLDEGKILWDGHAIKINNPGEAQKIGLSMIHQELNLIPDMTIAENMFAGREIKKGCIVRKQQQNKATDEALKKVGLELEPKMKVRQLKTAQMQMVEIAKAVSFGARLIIMDEPTSSISQGESEKLFAVIRKLKTKGISFIYISHRLEEIFCIADRITVLRDGTMVGEGDTKSFNKNSLIRLMVGRELKDYYPVREDSSVKEVVLSAKGLSRKNEFQDIYFELRRGEILGFGGLVGAGRTEMVMALFGLTKLDSGEVELFGKPVRLKSSRNAIAHKLALIPEDRKSIGLNLQGNIIDNIMAVTEKKYSRYGCISYKNRKNAASGMVNKLSIKTGSFEQLAGKLSGGNQQKVVLAKWLLNEPDILILDEPTRGIDVGSKAEIYKLINDMSEQGKSIIFISSEMPELIGMCDRIIVLCEGKMAGVLEGEEITQERIMALASGAEISR